jgi:hypothetical protein
VNPWKAPCGTGISIRTLRLHLFSRVAERTKCALQGSRDSFRIEKYRVKLTYSPFSDPESPQTRAEMTLVSPSAADTATKVFEIREPRAFSLQRSAETSTQNVKKSRIKDLSSNRQHAPRRDHEGRSRPVRPGRTQYRHAPLSRDPAKNHDCVRLEA